MRVNILCAGKVLGTAIKNELGVSYVARPGSFDVLADMAETEAHCAEFNALKVGRTIYAKPAIDCRYNAPAR